MSRKKRKSTTDKARRKPIKRKCKSRVKPSVRKSRKTANKKVAPDPEIRDEGLEFQENIAFLAVTPDMLVNVLRPLQYARAGINLHKIVTVLRSQNPNLNSDEIGLYQEVAQKLECAFHLGVIHKRTGSFTLDNKFRRGNLSAQMVDLFWKIYNELILQQSSQARPRAIY